MRGFPVLGLVVGLGGCIGGSGPKHRSGWEVLDSADAAACAAWPVREKELQVRDVLLARGKPVGFVVAAMKRDTAPAHYYAPFDDDPEVDPEAFLALDFGRGARLLGGFAAKGAPVALIAQAAGATTRIEIRGVRDNVVRYAGELGSGVVEAARVVPGVGGSAWLSVAFDDGTHRLYIVDLGRRDAVREVQGARFPELPRALPHAARGGGALLLWREQEAGSSFRAQWIGSDGQAASPVAVDIPIASQVESWSATAHGDDFYVAVVDGDSLIGQADLKVSRLNWDDSVVRVRWTKASRLTDEHVTEPVFVASERGLEALVLKWIDEESTIARYMVAGRSVGRPQFSGIFAKGSRILEAFAGSDGDDVFVLVRSRGEVGWSFRLCEI